MELTSKEHKKLIKQIERLCEKQYRKGVQHGRLVSDGEASDFRHSGGRVGYRSHECLLRDGRIEDYTGLLMAEATMDNMAELKLLLSKPQ